MVREFKDEYEADFTDEQLDRIDEVDNAAYNFACILAESTNKENENLKEDLPWDVSLINSIIYRCMDIMENYGYQVWYPFFTDTKNGKMISCDYSSEADDYDSKVE